VVNQLLGRQYTCVIVDESHRARRRNVPKVEAGSDEIDERAEPNKLNTDDARDTAVEFGISAIPTIILFKGGQVQKKWVGLTAKKDLAQAIDGLL